MSALCPSQRTRFLEHVVDVIDGNEVVVAESEIATGPNEARELNCRQA